MRTMILSLFALGTLLAEAAYSSTNQPLSTVPIGFEPVHYRPMAAQVPGLKTSFVSLDGAWRIDPKPGQEVREKPLNGANWGNFHVPGQWELQGYDIPRDSNAALAREFTLPANWAGYRIFLRFDAIHGGTRYWLNGKPLGYSENLFTPVEWEITEAVAIFISRSSRLTWPVPATIRAAEAPPSTAWAALTAR
jgi:beta-galactosidase/beta-glucuronidase